MFPEVDDCFGPAVSVDYRSPTIQGLDIWLQKKEMPTRTPSSNHILTDNKLLIRCLKQIEKYRAINGISEWEEHKKSISAETEKREIAILQMMLACFRVIVWDRPLAEADEWHLIRHNEELDGPPRWKLPGRATDKDICWDMIASIVYDYEDCFDFRIIVLEDIGVIETRATAKDLFSALFYQLLMHIKAGKAGLDGASIVRCRGCGKEFIRYTTRKHFCQECDTSTARAARTRAKQKEREDHGNH